MNIVLIEDEQLACQRMAKLIKEIAPGSNIVAQHDTVESARNWFATNPPPDLVLLDVQLSDGTAFDLLKVVDIKSPVIFTTAYDKYAIDAFATTSIDYLLKPIKKADLVNALQKLKKFQNIFYQANTAKKETPSVHDYKKRFVIRKGKKLRINKRVSGKVRLSVKQKMGIKKARMKSHRAGAQMKRAKSMRIRRKMNLK